MGCKPIREGCETIGKIRKIKVKENRRKLEHSHSCKILGAILSKFFHVRCAAKTSKSIRFCAKCIRVLCHVGYYAYIRFSFRSQLDKSCNYKLINPNFRCNVLIYSAHYTEGDSFKYTNYVF
jgi:hypothetical protein